MLVGAMLVLVGFALPQEPGRGPGGRILAESASNLTMVPAPTQAQPAVVPALGSAPGLAQPALLPALGSARVQAGPSPFVAAVPARFAERPESGRQDIAPVAVPARFTGQPESTRQDATKVAETAGPVAAPLAADTPVKRERAIEYSDWYARRLLVHKVASYTMLPMFAYQYYTGSQLMEKGADAPRWVIKTHGPMATAMLVVFSVNSVTGLWNLWDARKDPSGRTGRTLHALLMLASDAGFLTAGYLSKPAENSGSIRRLHRTVALASIGTAVVGYAIMLPPFRR